MNDLPSLELLANRFGTDKGYAHGYCGEYERHFKAIRERLARRAEADHVPIDHSGFKLLEIGIGGYGVANRGGHSLKMWEAYFPIGEIHGVDIEDKSFLDGPRIHTCQADQSDGDAMHDVGENLGPFDVVIDDGSHIQSHILTSFLALFPHVTPGGIYVIEDLETAYREDHGGDPSQRSGQTSINLVQALVDGIHWPFWRGRGPSPIDRMVKSVHVSKELVFIHKHG